MFLAPRRDKVLQMLSGQKALLRLDDRGWKLIDVRADGTLSETLWHSKTDQEAIALLQGSVPTRDQIPGVSGNAEAVLVPDDTPKKFVPETEPVPPREHIEQFFAFAHLPPHLQEISAPFCDLAHTIIEELPRNPERTACLRKLIEAKDCAIRAKLAK